MSSTATIAPISTDLPLNEQEEKLVALIANIIVDITITEANEQSDKIPPIQQ